MIAITMANDIFVRVVMRALSPIFPCLAMLLWSGSLHAGEQISDPRFNLQFTVPDGFFPHPKKSQGDVIYSYFRPMSEEQQLATVIVISRMRGIVSQDRFGLTDEAKQNPGAAVLPGTWKQFDIEVARVPGLIEGIKVVSLNAILPLTPEAIQIQVLGEETRENELKQTLRDLLRSMEGSSNWRAAEPQVDGNPPARMWVLCAVVGLSVLCVVIWIVVAKRSAS
jgi:hypothetical protein